MGRTKKKQTQKKRAKRSHRFLKPFLWTLCPVVAAGIAGMAAYLWIVAPAASTPDTHFQLTKEVVERGGEEEASQIEEIIAVNDKYGDILNDPAYMIENNIYAKDAADPEKVTIAFAGDILFDDRYAVMAGVMQNGGARDRSGADR